MNSGNPDHAAFPPSPFMYRRIIAVHKGLRHGSGLCIILVCLKNVGNNGAYVVDLELFLRKDVCLWSRSKKQRKNMLILVGGKKLFLND